MSQLVGKTDTLVNSHLNFGANYIDEGSVYLKFGSVQTDEKFFTNDLKIDSFNNQEGYLKVIYDEVGIVSSISVVSKTEKEKEGVGETNSANNVYLQAFEVVDNKVYSNHLYGTVFWKTTLGTYILIKEEDELKIKTPTGTFPVSETSNIYGESVETFPDADPPQEDVSTFEMKSYSALKSIKYDDNPIFEPLAIVDVAKEKLIIL